MKITWNTNELAPLGHISAEDGRQRLVAENADFIVGLAMDFGWKPAATSTVVRAIHEQAVMWLRSHDGATAEDPGYFEEVSP